MKRKWNDLYPPAQIWSPNTESIQNNGHWIDLIDEDTLTGLRSCAIIQIIFGLLLFIRWLWKRNCPEVTEEVTRQVVPVGTETRTVIGEQGSQVVGVQQVNTIYAATQNVTQVLTYDKPSWTYVFVNFIILLSGTCGILSLYYDMSTLNEEPIWLFRIFQVFISLSLAILIPFATVCALIILIWIASIFGLIQSEEEISCTAILCGCLILLIFVGMVSAVNISIVALGWPWTFGDKQIYENM